jgi:penicillin-binding protein 1A
MKQPARFGWGALRSLGRGPFSITAFLQAWFTLTFCALFLVCGVFVIALLRYQNELPSTAHLERIEPPSNTRIFDRNGASIGDLFAEDRIIVPLEEIPPAMVSAVLAAEDRHFYDHWGIEIPALVRAAVANVRSGSTRQGGSTITQQLARNLFLTHERTFERKIKEALLTIRLERIYTKDEILAMYFNQIYYGNGAHGAKSAAREYFGKDLSQLSLGESAFLAGLPANPTLYDPRRRFENAKRRQEVVLSMMVRSGELTKAEGETAKKMPIEIVSANERKMLAPYFVEYVRQELAARYGADNLYKDGLQVVTTLDLNVQKIVEEELEAHIKKLEKRNRYKVVRKEPKEGEEPEESQEKSTPYLQAAAVVLDTSTGEILAMVGGRNFWESRFNRATQAKRQPGSAFKAFVYTAALEQGIGPSTILQDEPLTVTLPNGDVYEPVNHGGTFQGPMSMRRAFYQSVNIPAVRTILTIGPKSAVKVAQRCGITTKLRAVPSLALGSSEVTLLELTAAYTVFPDGGILHKPWFVREIRDRNGAELERGRVESHEVMSEPVAAVMTDMMQDVMNRGTGAGTRAAGFTQPCGGKTGTMDEYSDAFFIGFTSLYTMGVWVGFDSKKSIGHEMTGTEAALPIWTASMIRMHEGKKAARFELPDGVVSREVCLESGYLASPGCSITGREIFPEGKQPKEVCPMHSGLDSPFDELRQETTPQDQDVIPQEEEPEPSTESEIPDNVELYRPGLN